MSCTSSASAATRTSMTRAATRTATTSARRRAGYSLVELMIALTAGAMVISSTYFIGAASSRHFQEQQRVGQTQTAVRLAMDMVQRDLARAGYLGTASSLVDQRCLAPAFELQAVEFQNDVDNAMIPNAALNGVSADRVTLVGSYASNDAFLATGLNAAGDALFLQTSWQMFRRNFGIPPIDATATGGFASMFTPGRVLRIRTQAGNVFYTMITAANPGAASVSFAPALGVGGLCIGGLGDGATVSVLSRIEYRVDDGTGFASASINPASSDVIEGRRSYLLRREVTFAGVAIANSERVVLENVVDFNLEFVVDQEPNRTLPANLQRLTGMLAAPLFGSIAAGAAGAAPQRARSAIVSISGRTADQDPSFPYVLRGAGQPLTRFKVTVNAAYPGAARVRSLTSEVQLSNLR